MDDPEGDLKDVTAWQTSFPQKWAKTRQKAKTLKISRLLIIS
jgi:hypothetical protein